jgi:hypothetical protein
LVAPPEKRDVFVPPYHKACGVASLEKLIHFLTVKMTINPAMFSGGKEHWNGVPVLTLRMSIVTIGDIAGHLRSRVLYFSLKAKEMRRRGG